MRFKKNETLESIFKNMDKAISDFNDAIEKTKPKKEAK